MKKFGIIGGGMIANFHAQAILNMSNAALIGIYTRNLKTANSLAQKYNCLAYSDFNSFLQNQEIEIVTIATPSGAHKEFAIESAKAGKHIICEKPLEISVERIDEMIEIAADHNVILSGIFNRRFNPAVEVLKKAIQNNRFGKLTLCDAQIKWYRDQAYYDSGDWRGTWQLDGGGALMNQSIHTIDLLLYLVGDVQRVSATMATLTHNNIEVEDTAVAILEFKNGARGSIQGSTSCWSSKGHPAEIHICGEHGSVFMADESFSIWDFKKSADEDEFVTSHLMNNSKIGLGANDPSSINFSGHQHNFEDVVEAIENERPPRITGKEARKSVQLINAIYQSAKSNGNWIEIN